MASVHELLSHEYGGPIARAGFQYQDDVAAHFCVEMLGGSGAEAVWCELLDDITLIWTTPTGDEPEFVQVKGGRGERMWSVAMICSREGGRAGSSIAEKSLSHDRCDEQCRFRLVTATDVAPELRPLTAHHASPDRTATNAEFAALCRSLAATLPDARSSKGNDLHYWAERAILDVRGERGAVRSQALEVLGKYLHAVYAISAPDQVEAVYELLLKRVFDAALADARRSLDSKKIRLRSLSESVLERVASLRSPSPATGGTRLRHELVGIGLPDHEIGEILERFYRETTRARRASYLEIGNLESLDDEIDRLLQRVRLQRLSGELSVTDLAFHNLCIDRLTELWSRQPQSGRPPHAYLVSRMYERVNRGLHQFTALQTGAAA